MAVAVHKCPVCDGLGKKNDESCPACKGKGFVQIESVDETKKANRGGMIKYGISQSAKDCH